MRFAAKTPAQRIALAAAAALTVLAASGCSYINPQSTTQQYSASDGVHGGVGDLDLRNILLVSSGENDPARIVGTAFNDGKRAAELTFTGQDGSKVTVKVPAKGDYMFDLNSPPATLDTTGGRPGSLVRIKISTGSAQPQELNVPVLDGTLQEYRKYIPSQSPSPGPSGSTATKSAGA